MLRFFIFSIRRRRLTLAAFVLQRGEKVIDVALRCGYEAPESFSRAFKGLHGILPSAACREGAVFQACPSIAFHISVRGDVAMQYRIEQKEAFSLFRRSIPVDTQAGEQASAVPAFWYSIREDGTGSEIRQAVGLEEGTPLHGAIRGTGT
jgi:AraC family transcriptional regulator